MFFWLIILDLEYSSIIKGISIGIIILISSFSLIPLFNLNSNFNTEPTHSLSNVPVNLLNWVNNQSPVLINYLQFYTCCLNGSSTYNTFKELLFYDNVYILNIYSPFIFNDSSWMIKTSSIDNLTNDKAVGHDKIFTLNESNIINISSSLKNFVKKVISFGNNKSIEHLDSIKQIYINSNDRETLYQNQCDFYGNDNVAIHIVTLPTYIIVYSQSYMISLQGSSIISTSDSTMVYYLSSTSLINSMTNSFYETLNNTLITGS